MRVVHSGRWWAMVGILVSVRRTGGWEWCGSGGWAQHSFVFFESKYLMQPHCLWTTLAVLCWISEKPTGYVAILSEQDKLFCKDIGLAWRVHFAWVEMYTCMERSIRSDFLQFVWHTAGRARLTVSEMRFGHAHPSAKMTLFQTQYLLRCKSILRHPRLKKQSVAHKLSSPLSHAQYTPHLADTVHLLGP